MNILAYGTDIVHERLEDGIHKLDSRFFGKYRVSAMQRTSIQLHNYLQLKLRKVQEIRLI